MLDKIQMISLMLLLCTAAQANTSDKDAQHQSAAMQNTAIPPLEAPTNLSKPKVALGEALFNDARLSSNLSHSCATCHNVTMGGTDRQATFVGTNHREGTLNTPTVFNVGYNFRQFWDGRAKNLRDVINDHILDKHILNNQWDTLLKDLNENPKYHEKFKLLYSDGVNKINVQDALETYLQSLVTINSPFDLYLKGDTKAISDDAIRGYELFNNLGCISCHQGPNIGGNLYQKMGIYKDYFNSKKKIAESDLGRFNVTNKDEDTLVFKVPSLRNIALTAPYLHDGSAKTLEDVVQIMAEHQIGKSLKTHEISYIVKFLETLTGEQPASTNINKKD